VHKIIPNFKTIYIILYTFSEVFKIIIKINDQISMFIFFQESELECVPYYKKKNDSEQN